MKTFDVRFHVLAEQDLLRLHRYIEDEAGLVVAAGLLGRIQAACRTLATFPERGARRDDLGPGLRTIAFERKATILFRIVESEVTVLRVLYRGRDIVRALRPDDEA